MAKQMDYPTPDGVPHPESYWKAAEINMNAVDMIGQVVFYGYHDAKASGERKVPIAKKFYEMSPDAFVQFFSSAALAGKLPAAQAYALAVATMDTDGDTFFKGALDV